MATEKLRIVLIANREHRRGPDSRLIRFVREPLGRCGARFVTAPPRRARRVVAALAVRGPRQARSGAGPLKLPEPRLAMVDFARHS